MPKNRPKCGVFGSAALLLLPTGNSAPLAVLDAAVTASSFGGSRSYTLCCLLIPDFAKGGIKI
ncbi:MULTISPECIES: hypothetical protein [Paenibacillus]|uniref:hypothetical protein n=1 Tax=Paenibacillus TaxID=44249 RepID=UPI001C10CABB|nr:hypothetical protein [Paenibacillus lautus]MBU5349700.1 hypothetical protein [Paenibacillus lautus]